MRATFDPVLHETQLSFSDEASLFAYLARLSGSPTIQNQALHEYTHYFCNHSPVTRAVRALRSRALLRIMTARKSNPSSFLEGLDDWRVADAIMQYLLPIYEGIALLAEFDLCLSPSPDEAHLVFQHDILRAQTEAAVDASTKEDQVWGLHGGLGAGEFGFLYDAHLLRIASDEFQRRKRAIFDMPLAYQRPEQCYLVAYLFAREAHRIISNADDRNADVGLAIKFLRSFFLEDWGMVAAILDIFDRKTKDTRVIIERLQMRLKQFAGDLTADSLESYRIGVRNLVGPSSEQHENLLPGLLIDGVDCLEVDRRLIEAELSDLANDDTDASLLIASLNNRAAFHLLHENVHVVSASGGQLQILGTSEVLTCRIHESVHLDAAPRHVGVYMCHVPGLPRFVWVEDGASRFVGWLGSEAIPNVAALAQMMPASVDQSTRARTIIDQVLKNLDTVYGEDFERVIVSASETASKIFGAWLAALGGFFPSLVQIASSLGQGVPVSRPVPVLLRRYFSAEEYCDLIKQSSFYGIGYNVGEIAQGEAKQALLNPARFETVFRAAVAMASEERPIDARYFVVEPSEDVEGVRFLF